MTKKKKNRRTEQSEVAKRKRETKYK